GLFLPQERIGLPSSSTIQLLQRQIIPPSWRVQYRPPQAQETPPFPLMQSSSPTFGTSFRHHRYLQILVDPLLQFLQPVPYAISVTSGPQATPQTPRLLQRRRDGERDSKTTQKFLDDADIVAAAVAARSHGGTSDQPSPWPFRHHHPCQCLNPSQRRPTRLRS